jgi:hypothetical protein
MEIPPRMPTHEFHIAESIGRAGTSGHVVFGFSSLVLQRQDFVVLPTATRRRMSGGGHLDWTRNKDKELTFL